MNPNITPIRRTLNGSGRPRLVVVKATVFYTSSVNTVYAADSVTETGGDFSTILTGMRVFCPVNPPSFGKITEIDTSNPAAPVLRIDGWNNGTPANGSAFVIDGYVVDLPRCQVLTEELDPYVVVHKLYRGRRKASLYGWNYTCVLDYSGLLTADALNDLLQPLNPGPDDRLILIPRADAPHYQYNAYWDGGYRLALRSLGHGYKNAVLKLRSTELVNYPRPLTGYGAGYGQNYGNQL